MKSSVGFLDDAAQDLGYGARVLARSPGFTLAAVVCLGIGVGLTTATCAQVRSTMFRPLPGTERPSELVRLQRPASFGDYEEFRDESGEFSSLAAYIGPSPFVIGEPGRNAQRAWGHLATPNYFEVLGVAAASGRVFGPAERTPGAAAAILSHRLWQARFGGDESIVGQAISVNGRPVTVIGVARAGFLGASPATSAADIWIPTTAPPALAPELQQLASRRTAAFEVVGRLKPGRTLTQAEAALEGLARRLEEIHGDPGRHGNERRIRLLPGGRLFPVRDEDLPRAMGFPLVLLSLVLLMACGNVANMLLARGAARRREIAVRRAVGAGPGRIVRQLLTESLLLAALGGTAGMLLALWLRSGMESLRPLLPNYVHYEVQFDWWSFGAALVLTAGTGVVSGLVPAFRSSRDQVYSGLKPGAASGLRPGRWFSTRNLLVFQQVAVSMVLLLLTAFVVIGWRRSTGVDIGFETANLYMISLDPVRDGYSPEGAREFFDELPRGLERVPGVAAASLTQTLPLAMSSGEMMMGARVDFAQGTRAMGAMRTERVGSGFFETVGARLLRGRSFTTGDQRDGARVLVVNETMASQAWPGRDALGQQVMLESEPWEVVGVVRDLRSAFPLAPAQPALYRPASPSGFAIPARHGVTLLVRVSPGLDAPTVLRREIEAIDPNVSVLQVKGVSDEVEKMLFLARVATVTYGGMGAFGLILSAVGLAGVTAYAVARRTHEIGIRMALGARRGDVLRLVLGEAGAIAVAGTLVGLGIALVALRALASFVETLAEATRTSATDPALLLGAPALLAALALLACYLPARRATSIDPVLALRSE